MGESIAEVAARLTPAQRNTLKSGAAIRGSLTTVVAMSLPLIGCVERNGGFNRWKLTNYGRALRNHLISQGADHDR